MAVGSFSTALKSVTSTVPEEIASKSLNAWIDEVTAAAKAGAFAVASHGGHPPRDTARQCEEDMWTKARMSVGRKRGAIASYTSFTSLGQQPCDRGNQPTPAPAAASTHDAWYGCPLVAVRRVLLLYHLAQHGVCSTDACWPVASCMAPGTTRIKPPCATLGGRRDKTRWRKRAGAEESG